MIIKLTTSREIRPVDIKITPNGKRRTISTSKIKKIIVTRKKRREKGTRAFFNGSKPHSNGDNFSRSLEDFFPVTNAKAPKMNETIKKIKFIKLRVNNNRS